LPAVLLDDDLRFGADLLFEDDDLLAFLARFLVAIDKFYFLPVFLSLHLRKLHQMIDIISTNF